MLAPILSADLASLPLHIPVLVARDDLVPADDDVIGPLEKNRGTTLLPLAPFALREPSIRLHGRVVVAGVRTARRDGRFVGEMGCCRDASLVAASVASVDQHVSMRFGCYMICRQPDKIVCTLGRGRNARLTRTLEVNPGTRAVWHA